MRTIADVETDLALAYEARRKFLSNTLPKVIELNDGIARRTYESNTLSLDAITRIILILEHELSGLRSAVQIGEQRFKTGMTIPLHVTKFGDSR